MKSSNVKLSKESHLSLAASVWGISDRQGHERCLGVVNFYIRLHLMNSSNSSNSYLPT